MNSLNQINGIDLPELKSGADTLPFTNLLLAAGDLVLYARNIVSDLCDNVVDLPMGKAECVDSDTSLVMDLFLPNSLRKKILELSKDFEPGVLQRCKVIAGRKEYGTQHGHYFFVKRLKDGVQLSFVDPESVVGKKNRFRPSVTNLMAAEVTDSGLHKLGILRFRHNPDKLINVPDLTKGSFALLDNVVPAFLDQEGFEGVFKLLVRPGLQIVESRHATDFELESLLENGRANLHLGGKALAQRAILNNFVRYLQGGDFKLVEK